MLKGISSLNVFLHQDFLGRLALTPEGLCAFEYAPEFLTKGFSISPFYLPLRPGLFIARPEPFGGNFGVFNDSLPDGWGHLLLNRYLAGQGIDHASLSILDRLSLVGQTGMGALEYLPDQSISSRNSKINLDQIALEIRKIIDEIPYSGNLEMLIARGGSSAGARPKVLIEHEAKSWMVKFPASQDPEEIGLLEYETAQIARKCGILIPETRLFEGKYFGIQRFDRIAGMKIHMLSASGLLHASHRYPALDYTELIKATRILTHDLREAYRLFRVMVFNVLIGNMDDHAKNFSFLHDGLNCRLSPAYDLIKSSGFNGNHTTTVAGAGRPQRDDIDRVAEQCDLDLKKCHEILDEVYQHSQPLHQIHW